MPIANTPLNKAQFEFLQQNITDQQVTADIVGTIAQSGLHYVVLLQVDAPEIDLVNPFADQFTRVEGLGNDSNFTTVVGHLNTHAATRGSSGTGTLTDKLNAYLENGGNRILVSSRYASLSAQAGFIIDPCYIDPGDDSSCLPGVTSSLTETWSRSGAAFSYTITAVGKLPITYNATSLPAGLSFATPVISGTVALGGIYNITLTATNSLGATTKTLVLTVVP